MKIIRSTQNYTPDPGEKPSGVSLTVPDDSYTIKELLARHEAGLGLGIQRLGNYDLGEDDEDHDAIDMNQFQQLDITDKEILLENTREIQADAKRKVAEHKKRKEKEGGEQSKDNSNV